MRRVVLALLPLLAGCIPPLIEPTGPDNPHLDWDGDGYSEDNGDCNDTDEALSPETVWYPDADGDGLGDGNQATTSCTQPDGFVATPGDCDDDDAQVGGLLTFYQDVDGDGFGDPTSTTQACTQPKGFVPDDTDCDDSDEEQHPGAVWYVDEDGDGYGLDDTAVDACERPGDAYAPQPGDCDDAREDVSPAGQEVCDDANADEDCDGLADDADDSTIGVPTWYDDDDGDGYGDPTGASSGRVGCEADGQVTDGTDCDDGDPDVNPGEPEICNGTDDDCDGDPDDLDGDVATEDVAVTGATVVYTDADGDGFGDSATKTAWCEPPADTVTNGDDCDDADFDVKPSATELCDAGLVDEDCDGLVNDLDPDAPKSLWYPDLDGDRYGDRTSAGVYACFGPSSYVPDDTDCDDSDATVNPGESEVFDGKDADCDGLDVPCGGWTYTVDAAGGADFTTIQDAVDHACTDDRVEVAAGTYAENVAFTGKSFELVGAGSATTTIDGGAADAVLTLFGGETSAMVIEGFTLTNGKGSLGGGIAGPGAASPTLVDLVITGNVSTSYGGGAYFASGSPTFSDVSFTSNTAYSGGGGLYLNQCSGASLDAVTFTSNTAKTSAGTLKPGGGLYCQGASSGTTITSSTFSSNSASSGGGAYVTGCSDVVVEDSTFSDNSAGTGGNGGAVDAVDADGLAFHAVVFDGNTAAVNGGGLELSKSASAWAFSLDGVVLVSNTAGGYGGAVHDAGLGSSSYTNVTLVGNSATIGGAVAGDTATHTLTNTIVSGNTASTYGGGLYASSTASWSLAYDDVYGNSGTFGADCYQVTCSAGTSPGFQTYFSTLPSSSWDLHLAASSSLVDKGSPLVYDGDGSRSDVGAYAGVFGDAAWYATADGDTMYDGWEEAHGLDTTSNDGSGDLDGDGSTNLAEFTAGTLPDTSDTDGDGYQDSVDAKPLDKAAH